MMQSFEKFLRDSYNKHPRKDEISYREYLSYLNPYTWEMLAEQWSSQQTDDEVYEALEELVKEINEYNPTNIDLDKYKAILARKGNKDGEKGA